MDRLITYLWNLLVVQLRNGVSIEQVYTCLSLMLQVMNQDLSKQSTVCCEDDDFWVSLWDDMCWLSFWDDSREKTVLTLLQLEEEKPAICDLIWSLTSKMELTRGAKVLNQLPSLSPTVIEHILDAEGSNTDSSTIIREWLSKENTGPTDESSKDETEEGRAIPHRLIEAINLGHTVLKTVLRGFKVGESVGDISPGNLVHTQTRGYLLA